MRSSIADYQVIAAVTGPGTSVHYLCRPPERLDYDADEVLVSEVAVDPSGWQRLTELLAGFASTGSNHLLSVLEVGPDPESAGSGVYVATESVPRGWLSDARSSLSGADRMQAVADAARGVHALHERGLAHGAITDRAVALAERGGLLSPPPLDLPPGALTRMADWRDVVTLDPNLLAGEESSRASDIWSLGATLHLALSERSLYPGIEADAPVTAVQRLLFTRPEVDPDLPSEVADVIRTCLQPDAGVRPATAGEVADRLQAAALTP
ncbi:MAG TPA: hypothetical protein VLX59_11265 [Acidimicrobiales bacterium]|nr:hypothetical protein [Acidimicrobiales bacterium]